MKGFLTTVKNLWLLYALCRFHRICAQLHQWPSEPEDSNMSNWPSLFTWWLLTCSSSRTSTWTGRHFPPAASTKNHTNLCKPIGTPQQALTAEKEIQNDHGRCATSKLNTSNMIMQAIFRNLVDIFLYSVQQQIVSSRRQALTLFPVAALWQQQMCTQTLTRSFCRSAFLPNLPPLFYRSTAFQYNFFQHVKYIRWFHPNGITFRQRSVHETLTFAMY